MFASRTRSVSTCTVRGLGRAAFAAAKIVTASFNAGPVFSHITAVLARGFKFSFANFCPAADVDVNTRPSVTSLFLFVFSSFEFFEALLATVASRTFIAPRLVGACSSSFFYCAALRGFRFSGRRNRPHQHDTSIVRCKGNAPFFVRSIRQRNYLHRRLTSIISSGCYLVECRKAQGCIRHFSRCSNQ